MWDGDGNIRNHSERQGDETDGRSTTPPGGSRSGGRNRRAQEPSPAAAAEQKQKRDTLPVPSNIVLGED
jgi:hypothetical protein